MNLSTEPTPYKDNPLAFEIYKYWIFTQQRETASLSSDFLTEVFIGGYVDWLWKESVIWN